MKTIELYGGLLDGLKVQVSDPITKFQKSLTVDGFYYQWSKNPKRHNGEGLEIFEYDGIYDRNGNRAEEI